MTNKSNKLTRSETLEKARSARHIPPGHKSIRGSMILADPLIKEYQSQSPAERGETYSIGQEIQKDGNLVLYDILSNLCKKHQTHWIDSTLYVTTEYGEYQDTNHARVLLMAIKDAIAALNAREPRVIVDDDDFGV